jgi:hypothetical protein
MTSAGREREGVPLGVTACSIKISEIQQRLFAVVTHPVKDWLQLHLICQSCYRSLLCSVAACFVTAVNNICKSLDVFNKYNVSPEDRVSFD